MGRKIYPEWNDDEIQFVKDNWKLMSDDEIAEKLNRTESAVKSRRRILKLKRSSGKINWKNEQIDFIKRNWRSMSDSEIGRVLNINPSTIANKRKQIGLINKIGWEDWQIQYLIKNNGLMMDKEIAKTINKSTATVCEKKKELGINTVYNKEYFVDRANKKHDNKFDYSQSKYVDMTTNMEIICPTHGLFHQTPTLHLDSYTGCPKCTNEELRIRYITKTREDFIFEAKQIHGEYYIYEKTEYNGAHNKITITCRIHGDFKITPRAHLNGSGCNACFGTHGYTKENFVSKANERYESKFDYSKTDYINAKTKVCIICPKHGEFWQAPSDHLCKSHGCPNCANEKYIGEMAVYKFLSHNNINFKTQYTFNDCKNPKTGRKLKFDFYIEPNILIEYDGEGHFMPIDFAGKGVYWAENNLLMTQFRDGVKNDWVINNEYTLIRIPYWEVDNIENILKQELRDLIGRKRNNE